MPSVSLSFSKDLKGTSREQRLSRGPVTVASLVSGNVAVRYDEASGVVGTGGVVLAATSRLATADPAASSMDTSDSSMDTTNGGTSSVVAGVGTIASVVAGAASLTLVKAETPEHLAGTSTTSSSSVAGPVTGASGLFTGIAAANKTARPDDWLTANSPGSPSATLQGQHVVYTNPQQQLVESQQQQQPPLAHSSPLAHQQQPPSSNNGYASPMSTSSYDPYSPNSKIGKRNVNCCFVRQQNSQLISLSFKLCISKCDSSAAS